MFKHFLRVYKIHSRTLQFMYWHAKNDNEFNRIVRFVSKRPFVPLTIYHPYSLSFTTFCDVDYDFYDSIMEDYE